MSTIGTVSQLVGRAIAVKADGSERVLAIGDEILADELIRVSPDGSLQIKMENGEPLFLEGGQSWLATADTYQTTEEFDTSEAIADVDSIQAAILAGADPTEVAEETAAGGEGEAEGNEGSSIVQIIANREEVDPTAGFETTGFSDSVEDNTEEEFFDDVPKILGTTTVLLDEDDLVAEGALAADFEALKSEFASAIGLTAFAANAQGQDDIAEGDDLPSGALTVLSGNLDVDFGANGAGNITFNDSSTQPTGITSGGADVQYWISEDGHSLVAYVQSEGSAEIIFTAQITDAATGQFQVALYGALDHTDSTTEDNLILDLSFTIQDSDDDTAIGILRLDIDDDSPIVEGDVVNTSEDTSITIDVLANDSAGADGAEITSFTQPENGTVVLNEDSTFTFTPATNLHGQETFTYTLTDGDGDTATTTVTVNVEAVADAPNLIMSMSEAETNTGLQTIDISNVNSTGNGYVVTAYDINGVEADISTVSGTNHDGFGVSGAASGASTEIGSTKTASEVLKVEFDNEVTSIDVNFAWLSRIETAAYTFYKDGVAVGSGTTAFQSDTVDGIFTLSPDSGLAFDRVDFSAPLNKTDDYLVNSITFEKVESYSYDLSLSRALTDEDGSEIIGAITLDPSTFPDGVFISGIDTEVNDFAGVFVDADEYTLSLVSDIELTDEQINAITASVKSTETSNSDEAETATNAKVEFSTDDASAETSDLLMEGTSSADILIGGDGDDIIFGAGGDDSLSGGSGEDIFIWEGSDVGTAGDPAHDTVADFNAAEDVLNLTDLLSDGSHTIEGIDNGSGDLQVNVKDSGGNVVQEIELSGLSIAGDASETLQTLLDTGAIDDGI